jgi:hypothetical protein
VSVIKDHTDCILSLVYVYTTHTQKTHGLTLCYMFSHAALYATFHVYTCFYIYGTFLGHYEGVDNGSLHLTYKEAMRHFRASDYVLADPPHHYVIDGAPQDTGFICGAARVNNNFKVSNCHFEFNTVCRRMELITTAPLQEGMYEVLVNYDTPGVPPCYWTTLRRARLTEET